MITVEIYNLQILPETQLSILEGDNILNTKKFYFCELSDHNKEQLVGFLEELRNHFGFRFISEK